MRVFLNNCGGRKHTLWYGPNAFYDLRSTGGHATMLRHLKAGDECVVAAYVGGGRSRVVFNWFAFLYEDERRDEYGTKFRVFFGKHLRSEEIDKATAAKTEPYSIFFNVRGHFKQMSVIAR